MMTQQEVLLPFTSGIKGASQARPESVTSTSILGRRTDNLKWVLISFAETTMAEEAENVYINDEKSSVNLSK